MSSIKDIDTFDLGEKRFTLGGNVNEKTEPTMASATTNLKIMNAILSHNELEKDQRGFRDSI
jgi:hypothetical protein